MTRVLSFIWRGVLAFDRVGSRIPQLVQIWFLELFFAMSLTFFIGKILDIHGALGVPGEGGALPGVFWGALVAALVTGGYWVWGLVHPRVVEGSWTPMVRVPTGTGVDVYAGNRRARVEYEYLTSHPSYALLLLLSLPLPLSFWYFSRGEGDSTFYWRITGLVGMAILAVMAVARVLAWYVFRFRRKRLDGNSARVAWEIAWKPVLMLVVMCYVIVCIPLAVMFAQDNRRIGALPVVTVADSAGHDGEMFRVEGKVASDPVYWAPKGTGRGGNNYAGAGVLVDLPSGGQALLLAESMVVSDFRFALDDAEEGLIETQGKVTEEITEDQRTYYGLDEADFPQPPAEGRVLVMLTTP